MAFSPATRDRERDKFLEHPSGETSVRVFTSGGTGSVVDGVIFDSIQVTYPNATTEVFEYYEGGLAGTLNATVTVTYTDATKEDVSTVVRT